MDDTTPAAADHDGAIRVLVVDDHAVVRRGLFAFLDGEADLEVVGDAAGGAAALELLAEHTVGALLGLLAWWLGAGPTRSPREMAAIFERLTTPSVHAGLGLDVRP